MREVHTEPGGISTHTPLARRDPQTSSELAAYFISTHTPLARRDKKMFEEFRSRMISTHTPLARRDVSRIYVIPTVIISTHTPLARRDIDRISIRSIRNDFYSHAPCGARRTGISICTRCLTFLLTRPMRGATSPVVKSVSRKPISTHTPHAGRDRPRR